MEAGLLLGLDQGDAVVGGKLRRGGGAGDARADDDDFGGVGVHPPSIGCCNAACKGCAGWGDVSLGPAPFAAASALPRGALIDGSLLAQRCHAA